MKIELKTDRLTLDYVGQTFVRDGRIFRVINEKSQAETKELLKSGLIDELVDNKLFPKTWVSDVDVEGYSMVLEHEFVDNASLPFEWSFSMIRDAAICVLKVFAICNRYGYGLTDTHNYNVLMQGCKPIFVDFGSIRLGAKFDEKLTGLIDYSYLPLVLMSMNESTFAKRILSDEYIERFLPYTGYSDSVLVKGLKTKLYAGNQKNKIKRVLNFLGAKYNYKLHHLTPDKFDRLLMDVVPQQETTMWGTYHEAYNGSSGTNITPRFERIVEWVNGLQVESVLDIAGNQGLVSKMLVERCKSVRKVICQDYDGNAIEKLYNHIKDTRFAGVIHPLHSNILYPIDLNYYRSFKSRIKSQLVMCLALTHHLVLSQGFSLDLIMRKLHEITEEYLIVEFMPLGLWNGGDRPEVPAWYTLEWFQSNFEKYFVTVKIEQTEENRIMLLGRPIKRDEC